jgi:hypothetical protein
MSRVFVSDATRAVIYVFSDDHCPPHVHARHRSEGWIARVRFSYVSSTVTLISIAPLRNALQRRALNLLLGEIQGRLADCRRAWWTIRGTTCLANQWAREGEGTIELLSERTPDAKRIADATYDPAAEQLHITFPDGTTLEVSTRL